MKHIKQLDAIRGVGIIFVVMFHWLPVDAFYNTFPNRPFGVDVFFVLSGFLITSILLRARNESERGGIAKKYAFVNFFFRRALRIFPVYYLAVLIIVVSHRWLEASIRSELNYALTYTLNWHFYRSQYWGDLTTHLWTLAIEEQFYLLWPWVILLVNKKFLPHVIIAFIAVGVISQCLITDMEFGYLPTYTCFDAFGIGALIAWITIFKPEYLKETYLVLKIAGMLSALVLVIAACAPDLFFLAPQRTLRSIISAWIITYVIYKDHVNEINNLPVFNNKALLFIGKISYGMYIYHIFFPWMYYKINHHINQHLPVSFNSYLYLITFAENFMLLVLVSWLSWKYMERPLLQFKKRYDARYHKPLPEQARAGFTS